MTQVHCKHTSCDRKLLPVVLLIPLVALALSCLSSTSAENGSAINVLVTAPSCASQNCTTERTLGLWILDVLAILEARLEMDGSIYYPWVKKCRLFVNFYITTSSMSEQLSIPAWVLIFPAAVYLAVEAYLLYQVTVAPGGH